MPQSNEKLVLDAIPQPVISVAADGFIHYANFAAQEFLAQA